MSHGNRVKGPVVDGYNARDFGADRIVKNENWRDSGYTHYTALSKTGGQISWDVDPFGKVLTDTHHMSDRNIRGGRNSWGQ